MRFYFTALFFCFFAAGFAQFQLELKVDDSKSVVGLIEGLEGEGVEIYNITYDSPGGSPVGEFEDVVGLLGLDKGIVMSTGAAIDVRGPNNSGSISTVNDIFFDSLVDPDLASIIGGGSLNDQVIIEFDFVAVHNRLSFNYVFGSEEYLEFVNSGFNDVFGFFISGPGISGVKNLAVLENGSPVSVNSINDKSNADKYVNNGNGTSPNSDFYIQFDGYTKALTAVADVIPCEVYHVKLAIADAGDASYDSGVFIESGSFKSTGEAKVEAFVLDPSYQELIEGCHSGGFELIRPFQNLSDSVVVYYEMSGTAIGSLDYGSVSGVGVIPIDSMSLKLSIEPFFDLLVEGAETVILTVVSPCLDSPAVASAQLIIEDEIDYELDRVVICPGDQKGVNPDFDVDRDSLSWGEFTTISCSECPNPLVETEESGTIIYRYTDLITGCSTVDSVEILLDRVIANFDYYVNDNYTSLDAFFDNQSQNSVRYFWDFGDADSSSEFEPTHTYETPDVYEPLSFTIGLTAYSRFGCEDYVDTIITIGEPFFIPNVITANADGLNDFFEIKGISRGTWGVSIYNRWGERVFETDNYLNDFNPADLTAGVYYYDLVSPLGDKKYKGWIQVLK